MLSEKLVLLRKKNGLTQDDVARCLKISRQAYSLYELDKREMDFESLCLLADFYNVTTDYLLGRYDIKPFLIDSDDEIRIIMDYRLLDERGQENVKATLSFEVSRLAKSTGIKKPAI